MYVFVGINDTSVSISGFRVRYTRLRSSPTQKPSRLPVIPMGCDRDALYHNLTVALVQPFVRARTAFGGATAYVATDMQFCISMLVLILVLLCLDLMMRHMHGLRWRFHFQDKELYYRPLMIKFVRNLLGGIINIYIFII